MGRLARRLSARGVILLGCLGASTCAVRSTASAPPTPPTLRRVLIAVDVPDEVWVCVQPTASMQMWQPTVAPMVCVEQVGAIRWRASHEDHAN